MLSTLLVAAWISSGGNIINDSGNPWWLRNTEEVRWCLELDAETVSVGPAQVTALFDRALAYWRHEFTILGESGDTVPSLGTQRFAQVACSEPRVDLRLVLGAGALRPEERDYFGERLGDVVGIAVRTSYDTVMLRGRGFIYVMGDPYELKDINTPNGTFRPWTREQRLFRVLVHELGHVFGLPHVEHTVMDADGPAYWAHEWWELNSSNDSNELKSWGAVPEVFESCVNSAAEPGWLFSFLGRPYSRNPPCMRFELGDREHPGRMLARDGRSGEYAEVGKLEFGWRLNTLNMPVRVYLNPEQQVFRFPAQTLVANVGLHRSFMPDVKLVRPDGTQRVLQITASGEGYQVVAASDEGRGLSMFSLVNYTGHFGE